jgi:hypothetical protein
MIFLDTGFPEESEPDKNENAGSAGKSTNRGGRQRQINYDRLANNRDRLIEILVPPWGEVGWGLSYASSRDDLRTAFSYLAAGLHSDEYLIKPFLRSTTLEATAPQIRRTEKQRGKLVESAYRLDAMLQVDAEKLRESGRALAQNINSQHFETLLEEHFERLTSFRKRTTEVENVNYELKSLEAKITDQQASYAQTELLNFITGGTYAHNPRNLAKAMAGLPDVGCWQSFQLCDKSPSVLWPTRPDEIPPLYYRIFLIIKECCDRMDTEPDKQLVDLLRERIRAVPIMSDLRVRLKEEWIFLRQAAEETDLKHLDSGAPPYRIFACFMEKRSKQRSYEDSKIAEIAGREV